MVQIFYSLLVMIVKKIVILIMMSMKIRHIRFVNCFHILSKGFDWDLNPLPGLSARTRLPISSANKALPGSSSAPSQAYFRETIISISMKGGRVFGIFLHLHYCGLCYYFWVSLPSSHGKLQIIY